ncbi:hypothetical protein [Aquibacillus albus]|uniref:Lipoprotein n=1 Tax=Aquibacillus albus TaxID=1168171 RepID=A0ABS2N239_9BACI|nr:hypothetical protein [Aquibacillus albus]MBM7572194.1 hypothetical protein [Aquibacillus albus]
MRIIGVMISFTIFLLASCSNDTPAITKIDSSEEEIDQNPELVEKEVESKNESKVKTTIEFYLPEETVVINLDGVSILKQYLSNVDNKRYVINKMLLTPLEIPEYESLYLLQFSCENNACSYLLLDQKDEGRSYLVADLAKFRSAIPSQDGNKLVLVFTRSDDGLTTNKVVPLDINDWETLKLEPFVSDDPDKEAKRRIGDSEDVEIKEELVFTDYRWPISLVKWKDNETLVVTVPDIEKPNKKSLKEWSESEKYTREIELKIDSKEFLQ